MDCLRTVKQIIGLVYITYDISTHGTVEYMFTFRSVIAHCWTVYISDCYYLHHS
jgi:hypothetical protein